MQSLGHSAPTRQISADHSILVEKTTHLNLRQQYMQNDLKAWFMSDKQKELD